MKTSLAHAKRLPADPLKLRARVLYELTIRGLSYAEIGRQLGVTRQAVRRVFARPYPRMERAVAEAIDRKPEDLWPERYERRRRKTAA